MLRGMGDNDMNHDIAVVIRENDALSLPKLVSQRIHEP